MASMVLRQYGEQAPLKAAERIGELAAAGEAGGVQLWGEVAFRMNALITPTIKNRWSGDRSWGSGCSRFG